MGYRENTPFLFFHHNRDAANRYALESALYQLQDLERREITIIDGPILVDQILQYMPTFLSHFSMDLNYRVHLLQSVNAIPESSVFNLESELRLDNIYVDVSLGFVPGCVEIRIFGIHA